MLLQLSVQKAAAAAAEKVGRRVGGVGQGMLMQQPHRMLQQLPRRKLGFGVGVSVTRCSRNSRTGCCSSSSRRDRWGSGRSHTGLGCQRQRYSDLRRCDALLELQAFVFFGVLARLCTAVGSVVALFGSVVREQRYTRSVVRENKD